MHDNLKSSYMRSKGGGIASGRFGCLQCNAPLFFFFSFLHVYNSMNALFAVSLSLFSFFYLFFSISIYSQSQCQVCVICPLYELSSHVYIHPPLQASWTSITCYAIPSLLNLISTTSTLLFRPTHLLLCSLRLSNTMSCPYLPILIMWSFGNTIGLWAQQAVSVTRAPVLQTVASTLLPRRISIRNTEDVSIAKAIPNSLRIQTTSSNDKSLRLRLPSVQEQILLLIFKPGPLGRQQKMIFYKRGTSKDCHGPWFRVLSCHTDRVVVVGADLKRCKAKMQFKYINKEFVNDLGKHTIKSNQLFTNNNISSDQNYSHFFILPTHAILYVYALNLHYYSFTLYTFM